MEKVSSLMRRYAKQYFALILALTLGIAVDNSWQSISSTMGNRIFFKTQHLRSIRIINLCSVHNERMRRRYVSILKGLPGYPSIDINYLTAKERLFPNSNVFIVDRNRSVTEGHAEAHVCSKCRAAERAWIESHWKRFSISVERLLHN